VKHLPEKQHVRGGKKKETADWAVQIRKGGSPKSESRAVWGPARKASARVIEKNSGGLRSLSLGKRKEKEKLGKGKDATIPTHATLAHGGGVTILPRKGIQKGRREGVPTKKFL